MPDKSVFIWGYFAKTTNVKYHIYLGLFFLILFESCFYLYYVLELTIKFILLVVIIIL